jgi:hypothetical protein
MHVRNLIGSAIAVGRRFNRPRVIPQTQSGSGDILGFARKLRNTLEDLGGLLTQRNEGPAILTADSIDGTPSHWVNFAVRASFAMLTNIAIDRADNVWVAAFSLIKEVTEDNFSPQSRVWHADYRPALPRKNRSRFCGIGVAIRPRFKCSSARSIRYGTQCACTR